MLVTTQREDMCWTLDSKLYVTLGDARRFGEVGKSSIRYAAIRM